MKNFVVGDKSKALCSCCGLVSTTFENRGFLLEESKKVVPNILVGVCDNCNQTVSIPHQSTPMIQKVMNS